MAAPMALLKELSTLPAILIAIFISAADMIAVNKTIERGGTVNVLPEMSLEYACCSGVVYGVLDRTSQSNRNT